MPASIHKLPAPPPASREGSPESLPDVHHLVRERSFSPQRDIAEILRQLRDAHATGTFTLNLNQGSVASISFSERKKIAFE